AMTTVMVIEDTTPPDVTAMGTTINCGPGPFFVTANSTTPGVTYFWTDADGVTSTAQNPEVFGDGGTMNTEMITLVVTAPNGCTTTTTVTVIEDTTPPNVTATGGTITCTNPTITLMASSTTAGVTYLWTAPNGATSTDQNPMDTDQGGTYTLVVTAPNGCTAMTTVMVIEDTMPPNVTAMGTTINCGPGPFFVTANSTTSGVTYLWTDEDGVTSTEQNAEVFGDGNTMNTGIITLVVTAANGCTTSTTVTVIENTTTPNVTAMGGTINCVNGSVILMASSTTTGVTYSWIFPNGFSVADQNPSTDLAGSYTVVVTAPNGCTASEEVIVTENMTAAPTSAFIVSNTGLMATFTDNSTNLPTTWLWDFGNGMNSTEQNPVHDYITAGTYTVCLTSSNDCGDDTTCEAITVMITNPNDILIFDIGTVTGQPGSIIQIPVRVENFTNIVSFQKSIHIADPTVARLVGVSGFNLTELDITDFFLASDDTFTAAWFNSEGVSVPDGTAIYMLDVELLSTMDECTEVFIDGVPTFIEVANIAPDGSISPIPYVLKSGEACVLARVDILGSVIRENGDPLAEVIVECTTAPATITDVLGDYEFLDLDGGLDYTVTPMRNTNHVDGVTAIDLALIQRHILTIQLLDSPYKMIAADVDISGLVSGIDLVKIQQLILQITTEFPDFNSWRFVDQKFMFTDPANPFLDAFPEAIDFVSLGRDTADNDFIAMKLGDVNESAMGLQQPEEEDLNMMISEIVNADGSRTIEFRSADATAISAYQFDIQFDQYQMSLLEVIPGALPGLNPSFFGKSKVAEGLITTLWYDPTATEGGWELAQNELLFSLRFEAPAVVTNLAERIQTGVASMKSAGYRHNGEAMKIKSTYGEELTAVEDLNSEQLISQLSITPNPFHENATVFFNLKEANIVGIQLLDVTGRVLEDREESLGAGAQNIRIDGSDLRGAGMYYIKVQIGSDSIVRKIVFQN
ncbi:MAG: PKD repeat protein, partial [Polaribacter sp.]